MAALVFGDPDARRRLEAITHPAVRRGMAEETARLAAAGHDLAFYDTPLLFEVGLDRALDCVVVVWAPAAVQRARLAARDGLAAAGRGRPARRAAPDRREGGARRLRRREHRPAAELGPEGGPAPRRPPPGPRAEAFPNAAPVRY